MKFASASVIVAVGLSGLAVQNARANFLDGVFSISASVTPSHDDLLLADSVQIDEFKVHLLPGTAQGDFSATAVVTYFAPSMPVNEPYGLPYTLCELDNGLRFILTALIELSNDSDHLALHGLGIFKAPGFDDTFGDFAINLVKSPTPDESVVAFDFGTTSAVVGPNDVPEAGSSAMLLGIGAAALAALRRERKV